MTAQEGFNICFVIWVLLPMIWWGIALAITTDGETKHD